MTDFRFIHTADLHLGKRYSTLPDEHLRGRLAEARHAVLARIAHAARDHGAAHVLVAGDIFDTETPSDPVWRQALAAMGADAALTWWLLPGNHDSLAAEALWSRIADHAPGNVRPLLSAEPVAVAPGIRLLPAPPTRRYPGRDLTDWFAADEGDPASLRIGLAHGPVQNFGDNDTRDGIPPDRAATARLDYLALGDWHGMVQVGPRTFYPGAPERDGYKHRGRGVCLAVTLGRPGDPPAVVPVETGGFHWEELPLPLTPGHDAAQALRSLLPADTAGRRDMLLRVRAAGRASLAEQAAMADAADAVAPDFAQFQLDASALATEYRADDLDAIDRAGALRMAADDLLAEAQDDGRPAEDRAVASAALNRLYGYVREGRA
ncbi:DNA repair exonuclease [Rhodobacteraceae bacterium 2CG4]|uniref:DNA repair exonuclease n=1 Tax=Halovulum marinum TaxID=2662447 RepID=A0A6L5YXV9_9RHOB|nr:metallophosphoesterase [Halovulum marinum]MSU88692.1 DNA repair exonuclease [Halovulum marinum]